MGIDRFTHYHPDKLFVDERGVDEAYPRRGHAWIGTEHGNVPALGLYRKLMGEADTEEPMSVFTYDLTER